MQLTVDSKFLVQNPVAIFEYWYISSVIEKLCFVFFLQSIEKLHLANK